MPIKSTRVHMTRGGGHDNDRNKPPGKPPAVICKFDPSIGHANNKLLKEQEKQLNKQNKKLDLTLVALKPVDDIDAKLDHLAREIESLDQKLNLKLDLILASLRKLEAALTPKPAAKLSISLGEPVTKPKQEP